MSPPHKRKILYGNLIKNAPIANNLNTPSESEIADFAKILQKYIDERQYVQVSFSKSKILADSGMLNSSSNPSYNLSQETMRASGDPSDKDKFIYVTGVNFHDENIS